MYFEISCLILWFYAYYYSVTNMNCVNNNIYTMFSMLPGTILRELNDLKNSYMPYYNKVLNKTWVISMYT